VPESIEEVLSVDADARRRAHLRVQILSQGRSVIPATRH
jgi:hypothetical protein